MNVMVVLNEDELDVDRFLSTTIPMTYFVLIFVLRFSLATIKWLKSKPYDYYPYKFSLDILLNSLQQVYLSSGNEFRPNICHHPRPPDRRVDTRDIYSRS